MRQYDLEIRTLEFSKKIIRICRNLPKDTINYVLISQLVRAAGSVGANYREANDALSKKDFAHRMKITRKESKEANYWLENILEANPSHRVEIEILLKESLELKKIFSSIVSKLLISNNQ